MPSPAVLRFGAFTLDIQAARLLRDGMPVTLPARAVDALAYLITHRDRVVDKDEIIAAVWRDVTVTDDSLIHAISVLRRALGDDPAVPSYIETVPRRGYRFVGSVDVDQPGSEGSPMPGTTSSPEGPLPQPIEPRAEWTRHPSRPSMFAAAVLLLVSVAVVFDRGRANRESGAPAHSVRMQQSAPPGTELVSGAVVSPAGDQLAFLARDVATGRTAVWIRSLGAADARVLSDTEGASHPFFSPDGATIAFFRKGALIAREIQSGRSRTLAAVLGAPAGGSWGTQDVIVFAEWTTGLYAVRAGDGATSVLTRLDHTALDVAHAWPQFLPDGRRFLYQIISHDAARAGVYAGSLDSQPSVRVLDEASGAAFVQPGLLLYVRQGALMAEPFDAARLQPGGRAVELARGVAAASLEEGYGISASRDVLAFRTGAARQQLTWVDRAGTLQGTLEVPLPIFNFRLSPDGRYLVAAGSLTDATGVWLVDLARRQSTRLEPDGIAPLWSTDGAFLAFTARAGLDVHVRSNDGTKQGQPLASDQAVKILNDWSAKRQRIVYTRYEPGTKLDLWEQPLSGRGSQPLLKTPSNEVQARISPDTRWIAYASDESGTQQVYVRRYPELDPPVLISTGGGAQPQWRADQRELFYLAPDRSLMAVTVMGGNRLTFGTPRRLFRTSVRDSPSGARDSYAVMPDGRSFLIDARRDQPAPAVTLMLDWAAGLMPGGPTGQARPAETVALR